MSPKLSDASPAQAARDERRLVLAEDGRLQAAPDLQAVDERSRRARLPPAAPRPRLSAGARGSVLPAREWSSRRAAARRSACRRWRGGRRVCASAPRTAARVAGSRRAPARADRPDRCRERRRRGPRRRAARRAPCGSGAHRRRDAPTRATSASPRSAGAASCGAAPCIPRGRCRRSAVSRYVSTWLSVGPRPIVTGLEPLFAAASSTQRSTGRRSCASSCHSISVSRSSGASIGA